MAKLTQFLLVNFCLFGFILGVVQSENVDVELNPTKEIEGDKMPCAKSAKKESPLKIAINSQSSVKVKRQVYLVNPSPTQAGNGYQIQYFPQGQVNQVLQPGNVQGNQGGNFQGNFQGNLETFPVNQGNFQMTPATFLPQNTQNFRMNQNHQTFPAQNFQVNSPMFPSNQNQGNFPQTFPVTQSTFLLNQGNFPVQTFQLNQINSPVSPHQENIPQNFGNIPKGSGNPQKNPMPQGGQGPISKPSRNIRITQRRDPVNRGNVPMKRKNFQANRRTDDPQNNPQQNPEPHTANVMWTPQNDQSQQSPQAGLSWIETPLPQIPTNQQLLLLPSMPTTFYQNDPQNQYNDPQQYQPHPQNPQFNSHPLPDPESDYSQEPNSQQESTILQNDIWESSEEDEDDDHSLQNSRPLLNWNWPSSKARRVLKPLLVGTVAGLSLFVGLRAAQKHLKRGHGGGPVGGHGAHGAPTVPMSHPPFFNPHSGPWFDDFIANSLNDAKGFGLRDFGEDDEDTVREYNNKVAKSAIEFIKAHPDIETYITPSVTHVRKKKSNDNEKVPRIKPHENSYVNLTLFKNKLSTHKKIDRLGSTSTIYRIMCEQEEGSKKKKGKSKVCQNAIGVGVRKPMGKKEFQKGRTILIELKGGNDTAIGRPKYRHIFLVEKGQKFYKGQERSDTFVLVKEGVTGFLDGGPDASNSLVLGQDFDPDQTVIVELKGEHAGGSQIRQSRGVTLSTRSLQIVHGRADEPEKIVVGCADVKFVDGHGGKSMEESDVIEILREDSKLKWKKKKKKNPHQILPDDQLHLCEAYGYKNLEVKVARFTKIENHARTGNFTYIFSPINSNEFEFQIDALDKPDKNYDPAGRHLFLFNWKLGQISSLEFEQETAKIVVNAPYFGFSLPVPLIKINGQDNYFQQPKLYTMFEDGVTPESEIRVTLEGQVHVIHHLDYLHHAKEFSNHPANRDNGAGGATDKKYGFHTATNIFNIYNGQWDIRGGNLPDFFVLHSQFAGILNGGSKFNNSLVLHDNYLRHLKFIEINLLRHFLSYEELADVESSGGTENNKQLSVIGLENIHRVLGRVNASDLITIDCTTMEIDGRGGGSQKLSGGKKKKTPDVIIVPSNHHCEYYRATFIIREGTRVRNFATMGEFSYKIKRLGVFNVETNNFPSGTTHNYFLPYNFETIRDVVFDRKSRRIYFKYNLQQNKLSRGNGNVNETYHQSHWLKFSRAPGAIYHVAPNVLTNDGINLKVRRGDGRLMAFVEIGGNNSLSSKFLARGFKGLNGLQHTINLNNAASISKSIQFNGADLDDVFILGNTFENKNTEKGFNYGRVMGSINGMGGQNALQIEDNFLPGHDVRIDLFRNQIFSEKVGATFRLKLSNFSSIQGRRHGNETIVVGCHTQFVSGLGGHDLIIVPPDLRSSCNGSRFVKDVKMDFTISNYPVPTKVINFATTGVFRYHIKGVTSFNVERGNEGDKMENRHWSTGPPAQHIYQLSFKAASIDKAWFEQDKGGMVSKGKVVLKINKGQVARFSVVVERGKEPSEFFNTMPRLMTADGLRLMVNVKTGGVQYSPR